LEYGGVKMLIGRCTKTISDNKTLSIVIGLLIIFIVSSNIFGILHPVIFLNENQILYLFSTAAQVVGGIFGLIIAGYIFLRSEMDKQIDEDETKEVPINELKKEYFYLLVFLSINGALSILLSILCIGSEDSQKYKTQFPLLLNTTVSIIVIEVIAVFVLAILMIDPNRIETVSNKIKKSINKSRTFRKGNIQDLLVAYNRIEDLLNRYYEQFIKSGANDYYSKRFNKYMPKNKIIEYLSRREIIDFQLEDKINRITKYRNVVVHSNNKEDIDQEIIDDCNNIYDELESILSVDK
jgi:uncharacterized protein YutE (UPF0331/DUF86 family)